jgi:hypothetical protein
MVALKERGQTERNEALSLTKNGVEAQNLNGQAQIVYRERHDAVKRSRVNRLAGLAVELAKIESAIKEQQAWLHPQPCPCEQCSAVFGELLRLSGQRRKVLAEIIKLSA